MDSTKQKPDEMSGIIDNNLLELNGSVREEPENLNVLGFQLLEEAEQKNANVDNLPFSCEYCGARFKQKMNLRMHQNYRKVGIKYKCRLGDCTGRTFICKQEKYDHVELYHPPNQPQTPTCSWKCSECSFTATTLSGIITHSIIHKKMHRCDQCSYSFKTRTHLSNHKDIHHKHACSKCGLKFKTWKELRNHQAQFGNFKCLLCDEAFECEHARSQHLDKDHEECFRCPKCPYIDKDLRGLEHHCEDHHEFQLAALQHKALLEKLETVNVKMKFECDHCGLSFYEKPKLLNHILDHSTLICSCDECGSTFTSLKLLTSHRYSYSGNFKCVRKNCTKEFKCKRALNMHIGKYHEISKCPKCPAVFKTKKQLQAHRDKQHNKKFQCDLCELSFLKENSLKFHNWNFHTTNGSTRKFSCDECGDRFKTRSDLRKHEVLEHLKTQTKKKPKKKYKPRLHSNQNPQFAFVSVDSNESVPKQEREESSTVTFEGHIEKLAGYSIKEKPEDVKEDALPDIKCHPKVALNKQEMTSETNQRLETVVQHEQKESLLMTDTFGINIHVKEEPEVSYVLKFSSEEEEL